jgi:lysophospholipase L1-like esterase
MNTATREDRAVVACLGSSSTAGRGQAFNWIHELQRRPNTKRFVFRNFGIGGDLAYNALQRLPGVIPVRPHKVVILIGGNDVLACVFKKPRMFFRITKRLPQDPSSAWFRENLQQIVRRLKTETSATLGLCSLPPIGEDPTSTNPCQSELNRRVKEFSAMIQELAGYEKTEYIPIYESLSAEIMKSPGRAFTQFRFGQFYRDAFRTVLLRKSPDEVARMNGWRFHTDGVHLNSRGGLIVADLVQQFLES